MTTSTVDIGGLLSIMGAQGIEKQLQRIGGVKQASVNPVSGSATVEYDAARINLAAIEAAIRECGFHCAGEALPKHLCQSHAPSAKAVAAPANPGKPATLKMPPGHEGMAAGDMKMAAAKPRSEERRVGKECA